MAQASDYKVTTPYGFVAGYPLNNGFHNGEDRAMPIGTPILVNGSQIGLSGNTGASTGPHLHIGRWFAGASTNPQGGGFNINGARVTEIGNSAMNGNFVRVADADGSSWVYLHLSQISVKVGEELKGINMEELKQLREIAEIRRQLLGKVESAAGVDTGKVEPDNGVDQAIANIDAKNKEINELKARLGVEDEANILGRALIKVLATLGYKKG